MTPGWTREFKDADGHRPGLIESTHWMEGYETEDAALSAFAVFFSQSPSFHDSQVRMPKQQGKNNASALFGVHEIPSDNQIRKLFDPVPAATLFPVIADVGEALYRQGYLEIPLPVEFFPLGPSSHGLRSK